MLALPRDDEQGKHVGSVRALKQGWDLAASAIEICNINLTNDMSGKSPQQIADHAKGMLVTLLRTHRDVLIDMAIDAIRTRRIQ